MKTVLIEGMFLIVISLLGLTEGFRLIIYKDSQRHYDPLGPGSYILVLSVVLMASGIAHLLNNYNKFRSVKKDTISTSKEMKIKVISMVGVFVIYLFLMNIVGYLVATIIFFFLEFRVAGVKSWLSNIIYALIFSVAYHVVFVKYCSIVFPKGIFF